MSPSAVLRDLSIRSKLIAAFVSLVFMIGMLGVIAIQTFGVMDEAARHATAGSTLSLRHINDMRIAFMSYRLALLRSVTIRETDDAAPARREAAFEAILDTLKQAEAKYTPTIDDERERQLYQVYQANLAAYVPGTLQMRELLKGSRFDEALSFLSGPAALLGAPVDEALRQNVVFNAEQGDASARQITEVYRFERMIVAVTLLTAVVLACLAGWLLVRTIAVPVREMTAAMRRLADHDLTAEVVGTERRDEIGAMAAAVQVFKDNMAKADELTAQQAAGRAAQEQRASQLEALVHGFEGKAAGLIQALTAASDAMETTARSMSATAGQTRDQTTELASSADAASAGAQTVAAAAEELSASIGEISRQVDESSKITGQAVAAAQRTDAIVRALADGAQKIGDVVGLITDIASQTNLLALNATIEAARAGEAGKGFAVVAAEVKNLANQTGKATEEIAAQIAQIQNATKEAVGAIHDITQTIEQVSAIATAIAAAMEEQGSATAEIARNVQQTAASTDAVRSNIAAVSQAAADTGSAADQVLGAAGQLSQQADDLSREVTGFVAGVRAA